MVWKSTTTVAFGIRDRWVWVRYCKVKGNTGAEKEYKANVKQDCIKDQIDVCFQRAALKAHNEKRTRHKGGTPLKHDNAASNYIFKLLALGNF